MYEAADERNDDALESEFAPISIRYEGREATAHQMELGQLGESLQGFAKVFAVAASFVSTGEPYVHYDALEVKVYATPVQDHHCYEVMAVIRPIVASKEFWAAVVVGAATVLVPVLTYILSKRRSDEMKFLNEALQKSIAGNQATTEKLVSTIDKLADALTASIRKALAPIDRSCTRIDLYSGSERIQSLDSESKSAVATARPKIADHTETFRGLFTSFDIVSGAAKVQLESVRDAVSAKVLDPVFDQPNNPYASALATQRLLTFLAKAERDANGVVVKLHVFDTGEE